MTPTREQVEGAVAVLALSLRVLELMGQGELCAEILGQLEELKAREGQFWEMWSVQLEGLAGESTPQAPPR